MNKNTIFSTAILCSIIFIYSCEKSNSNWQGTTTSENGVKVVINPDSPYYGDFSLEIKENLSLGNEEDDNYWFYRAIDLDVDSSNHIYIVDLGNDRIQKYNQDGHFLQTIGGQGQGPGEFRGPLELFINSQNKLFVREYMKMSIFDEQGDFIRSYSLEKNLQDFAVDWQDFILGYADIQPRDPAIRSIVKIDQEGKIIKRITDFNDPGIKIVIGTGATYTLNRNHIYSPRLYFSVLDENHFIYGYSSDYLLYLIDNEGNIFQRIHKNEPPSPITSKEKSIIIDRIMESLEQNNTPIPRQGIEDTLYFQKHRAFFDRILVDDKQRIFIQKVKSVLDDTDLYTFDIFNREGYYLYRTQLPFVPEIIRDGYLYDINRSEETEITQIKRYRIDNWASLKDGI